MRRKRDARGGGGQKESRSIVGQALRGRGWGGGCVSVSTEMETEGGDQTDGVSV